MTIEKEMFARFLGLYIMGEDIPEDLYSYIEGKICPTEKVGVKLACSMILGAPNSKDEILRKFIVSLI